MLIAILIHSNFYACSKIRSIEPPCQEVYDEIMFTLVEVLLFGGKARSIIAYIHSPLNLEEIHE